MDLLLKESIRHFEHSLTHGDVAVKCMDGDLKSYAYVLTANSSVISDVFNSANFQELDLVSFSRTCVHNVLYYIYTKRFPEQKDEHILYEIFNLCDFLNLTVNGNAVGIIANGLNETYRNKIIQHILSKSPYGESSFERSCQNYIAESYIMFHRFVGQMHKFWAKKIFKQSEGLIESPHLVYKLASIVMQDVDETQERLNRMAELVSKYHSLFKISNIKYESPRLFMEISIYCGLCDVNDPSVAFICSNIGATSDVKEIENLIERSIPGEPYLDGAFLYAGSHELPHHALPCHIQKNHGSSHISFGGRRLCIGENTRIYLTEEHIIICGDGHARKVKKQCLQIYVETNCKIFIRPIPPCKDLPADSVSITDSDDDIIESDYDIESDDDIESDQE